MPQVIQPRWKELKEKWFVLKTIFSNRSAERSHLCVFFLLTMRISRTNCKYLSLANFGATSFYFFFLFLFTIATISLSFLSFPPLSAPSSKDASGRHSDQKKRKRAKSLRERASEVAGNVEKQRDDLEGLVTWEGYRLRDERV